MAKILICHSCGGRLSKDSGCCEYCGAEFDLDNDVTKVKIEVVSPSLNENSKIGNTYLVNNPVNYNTETNSDFDKNYHYQSKPNKRKIKYFFVEIIFVLFLILFFVIVFRWI